MKLVVCGLDDIEEMASRHRPDAVLGLLSPDEPAPRVAGDPPQLVLRFHDIGAPQEGLTAPDAAAVARLLDFAAERRPEDTMLVHCWMGISRSPAAAFVLACVIAPAVPEEDVAWALRRAAPTATPNPLVVSLADAQLGRGGRMVAAVSLIGRGREAARGAPFELDTARIGASSP
jgi:predicted protein tyrosine phosphatase